MLFETLKGLTDSHLRYLYSKGHMKKKKRIIAEFSYNSGFLDCITFLKKNNLINSKNGIADSIEKHKTNGLEQLSENSSKG